MGHLSRYLALVHKFKVITIESEGHHKIRAEQFDKLVVSYFFIDLPISFYFIVLTTLIYFLGGGGWEPLRST